MWKVWRFLALILPLSCPLCGDNPPDTGGFPLCRECFESLHRKDGTVRCIRCGVKITQPRPTVCITCMKNPPPLDHIYVYADFSGKLREAIILLKFRKNRMVSRPLAALLSDLSIPPVEAIVPVPLGKVRLAERGFCQSYQIARHLSRRLPAPVLDDLLFRTRETAPQSLLPRKERIRNVRGAFRLNSRYERNLPGTVLIVDDVMTTGATIYESARTLKKAGVQTVHALVLARADTS